ncbi:MAG TPA: carbohydrate-binding protein, partial [Candidatus Paceibacterota bacterium]|nr:carbohydrate-binding protein [Candidatus Paceibacterota bacterium]
WLTFQHFDSKDVGSDVTYAPSYKDRVNNSGLGWRPDYGNWPVVRGAYGNGGYPWTTADVNNNVLSGTLRIQAENFDNGGKGIAYYNTNSSNPGGQYRAGETVGIEATSDSGGGYDVGWTAAGDWLEYTMKISAAGTYNLRLRVAGTSAGRVQLIANGTELADDWTLPNTGGAQTWTTVTRSVFLAPGQQKLRLNVLAGGFNLNWIELSPSTTGPIANGTYKILNAGSALALDLNSGSTVITTNSSDSSYQRWNFQHIGGGEYLISSVGNGGFWSTWMAPLHTVGYRNGYYIFQPTKGGFYQFFTAGGGTCFQPSSGSVSSTLTETAFAGMANQQWAICAPTAAVFPVGLSATANSATQISLTWNAVSGATSYNIKRSTASGGPYTMVATNIAVANYTDTVTSGIKYYYVVSAVTGGTEGPDSLEASVNPPYPWASRDIGTVGSPGSVSYDNSVFTVSGSGDDIWNSADAFRYVYLTATGNCTITARVPAVQNTDGWAKAGVMIRASLTANSANAFMGVTPGNGVAFQYRSTAGGGCNNVPASGLTAPYWVRLVRSGNTFIGYRSVDGVTWTQQSSATISMGVTVYIGLAVTAHNNSKVCTATFDNVTFPGWPNWTSPLAPASLAAAATNGQVNLSWPPSANATSYNVRRSTTDGGPYTMIGNVSTAEFADANLLDGVPYYYVVSALNIAGESGNSPQAAVPGQFFRPTGLSVTPVSATQNLLVWNAFTNATGYNIKRSPTSGGPYSTVATGVLATNYTDTAPAGMKFYYVVSAMVGAMETPNSLEATFGLPYPWLTQDVGSVGLSGSAAISNGVFTVAGGGNDIWDAADAFRFIYVPVSGNCTVTARVISLQNTDPWAKAGIMVRTSLNANSANAFIAVTTGNGVTFQTRSTDGGNSANNNTTGLVAPYWVRLVRSGNTFTAYRSPNGVTWTQQGSATTISMASTVYVGLAVTAHNNSALCTAMFDNVTLPGWSNWTLPSVPTGLSGIAENGQATLTWVASANATSYNVKRSTTNGGPYTIIANTGTTGCTDSGITNGITYYYVVSALNPAGESDSSAPTALVSRPPVSLSLAGTDLVLSWPLASDGFRVQSCTNLVSGEWVDVPSPQPAIVGDQWQFIAPQSAGGDSVFYRLVK